MRGWAIGLAAVLLVGCGGNDVPSPAEREAGAQPAPIPEMAGVALHGEGLAAGAEAFYFAAGRSEIDAALERILSETGEVMANAECGAGPMDFTVYPSGLTVNYQDGKLVGWSLRAASKAISVKGDVAIGTPRAEAEAAPGFALIEDSTLGEEFMLGESLAGFIEDDAVSLLYAGTQCFFR